jgi:hypothetical protein
MWRPRFIAFIIDRKVSTVVMAVYILIQKVADTEAEAVFDFFPAGDKAKQGRLKLDKTSSKVSEVIQCPADPDAILFNRAAWKVLSHHLKAEYPQETCWAS